MAFYDEMGGENWSQNHGWRHAASGIMCDPCYVSPAFGGWYGVNCNDQNEIVGIDLDGVNDGMIRNTTGNNLSGQLFELNLPDLKTLILTGNDISGALPDFNNLKNLERLGLSFNKFTGPLPDFQNNKKLIKFRASFNQFTGPLRNINSLPDLSIFTASHNLLESCYPENVCDLELFDTSENRAMPWQGDHTQFCMGEDVVGAPCLSTNGNTGIINEDCLCVMNTSYFNSKYDIRIYPIPVMHELHLEVTASIKRYSITDLNGRPVLKGPLINNTIITQSLAKGMYFLSLEDNLGKIQIHKIAK